jgi:eukaryotic-like serine/threonine-protein kinase
MTMKSVAPPAPKSSARMPASLADSLAIPLSTRKPDCPTDAELAAYAEGGKVFRQAIETHLVGCEGCDLMVAMLRGSRHSSVYSEQADASIEEFVYRTQMARALRPGASLGRFELVSRLGVGAMGVVFCARDSQLDREVALKVLLSRKDEGSAPDILAEARSMARLSHPNVVMVFEVGSSEEHVFLAMELVRGNTLRDWLFEKPTASDVMAMFRPILDAVEAGHQAGIVHRDLKPQNILVTERGVPKISDFGLAQLSAQANRTHANEPRVLAGTPAYMPLEALQGGPVGPAGDQFALAVCLHEALAGRRPVEATTLAEYRIQLERVPPISREIDPRVRSALARALDPSPALRFASVADFANALYTEKSRPMAARIGLGLGIAGVLGAGALGSVRFFAAGLPTAQSVILPSSAPPSASTNGFAITTESAPPAASTAARSTAATSPSSARMAPVRPNGTMQNAPLGTGVTRSKPADVLPAAAPSVIATAAGDLDWMRARQ